MKITIEDDDGKQMSLETSVTVIPPGYVVLICPADKDYYINQVYQQEIEARLEGLGIRGLVVPMPIHVWSIADAERA